MEHQSSLLQPVSIHFDGAAHEAHYFHEGGVLTVIWYNPIDLKRHEACKASFDPINDATELLRELLIAAKLRDEI